MTGSICSSSALCESAGSLLKMYQRGGADTDRVVERVLLRFADVRGDGTDDAFALRSWMETCPAPENLSLFFNKRQQRLRKLPLRAGSKTLRNMRQKAQSKCKVPWTMKRVPSICRVSQRVLKTKIPVSVRQWHLGRRKQKCAGLGTPSRDNEQVFD